MKVGIIVHSQTGNTLSVAQRLMEEYQKAGHPVELERVTTIDEDPAKSNNVELKSIPDPSGYDFLIFAAPVWAFSLSPVMKAYLDQVPSLQGKKVSCFMTQAFPFTWMGGNRALRQFKAACEAKGATVAKTGIVNWSRQREKKITEILGLLTRT